MARITVAQLLERIEALEEELATLRTHSESLVELINDSAKPTIGWSLNKDMDLARKPISEPLDVHAIARGVYTDYSYYTEEGDIYRGPNHSGPNTYI